MCCQIGRFPDATFPVKDHLMDNKPSAVEAIPLDALRSGDPAAFANLVEKYSPPIYRLAMRITGNQQDAEDVLQETFIKAMNAIADFQGRSSISTWLYRIAVNEALMLLRRQKRAQTIPVEVETDDGAEGLSETLEIEDWCCLPEKELLSSESRAFLDTALNQLSPRLRMVFQLRDIEGLSIQETAQALELSEANVKTSLLRARLKLRELLTGYYHERLMGRAA